MWTMTEPAHEMILRALLIYFGLFLLFRFVGKKQIGEMSPFDFVVVLIISESVSNALGADDKSISGNLLSAATLLGMSYFMDYMVFKSKRFEKLAEGESKVLISDGKVNEKVRSSEKISMSEIEEALREIRVPGIESVKIAFLETNGRITAFPK